ncbi:MAG: ribokinase [Verrucomicrobia bacterium 61-8]|nr:ribokinase [Verrucomicrobiota bacterium]OJV04627.1 MAG: ribokinase [Verrucomicrobia bacterium 61-8]
MTPAEASVLVIGSINTDLMASAPRIPSPGETVGGTRFDIFQGGKGANQAVAARRSGARVTLVGRVGDDAFGAANREHLRREGIELHIASERETTSGVALITVCSSGENAITVVPGANGNVSEKDWETLDWSAFSVVLFQLEIPHEAVWAGLRTAREAGCRTILTPAPAAILPSHVLPLIDFLVPNHHEILLLQEKHEAASPDEAARALLDQGVKTVVLTLGAHGVRIFDQKGVRQMPAFSVEPVDTVGAGDCFTGVFAANLAQGASTEEAARIACAAAALSVTSRGAQSSYPGRSETERFLAR